METFINRILQYMDVFYLNHVKQFGQKHYAILTILNKPFIRVLLIIIILASFSLLIVFYKGSYKHAFNVEGTYVIESANSQPLLDQNQSKSMIQKTRKGQAIVVVDPGHGGYELGTTHDSLYEKTLNLNISLKLGKILKENGINVVYTRTTDKYVELKERAEIANEINADLFLSIHNNYMPNGPDYKGTETLYCTPSIQNVNAFDGEKFAEIVQNQLVGTLKTHNNGTIFRPNLAVLRRTKMPAVIAEIAYISNYDDRNKLMQDGFKANAALALSHAVFKSLSAIGAKVSNDGKWMFN